MATYCSLETLVGTDENLPPVILMLLVYTFCTVSTSAGKQALDAICVVATALSGFVWSLLLQVFSDVEPDPTLATVERAMADLRSFRPDVIIAVGGGSPMDAAKLMWLMYEHPNTSFLDIAARFMVSELTV